MTDRENDSRAPKRRWLLVALALVAVLAVGYYYSNRAPSQPLAVTTPPSTEWTTAPDTAGVPVDIPQTRMTNVPAEAAPATAAPSAASTSPPD